MVARRCAQELRHPLDLAKLLSVFAKSKDEKVGLALVTALRDPAVRPAIRAEMVKPILDKYPKSVQAEAEKLYAELAEARKGERAKLEKMLAELKPGDIRRGQLVFNNAKTQCIACHKVGYVGGLIGPDLTRIGGIRTERDLLEAIVFPSASFVRSYEPVRVVTTDERDLQRHPEEGRAGRDRHRGRGGQGGTRRPRRRGEHHAEYGVADARRARSATDAAGPGRPGRVPEGVQVEKIDPQITQRTQREDKHRVKPRSQETTLFSDFLSFSVSSVSLWLILPLDLQ